MVQETLFEKIVKREIPASIVYEDEMHLAFLDIHPFEKGETLVITKRAYPTIHEIPENEFADLMRVVKKIADHYEKVLGCGINIVQNNKSISGQIIPHIHVHVIPRREDKEFSCSNNYSKYLDNEPEIYRRKLELK